MPGHSGLLSVFKGPGNLNKNRLRHVLVDVIRTMHIELPIQQDVIVGDVAANTLVNQDDHISFCAPDSSIRERRQKDKEERLSLVLWRRPVTTLHYFLLETLIKLKEWTLK